MDLDSLDKGNYQRDIETIAKKKVIVKTQKKNDNEKRINVLSKKVKE